MIPLLQRQIFRETAGLFVLGTGVLLTLVLISRVVQMRELLLGLDLGILDTVLLFTYMTPLFLMLVMPIACMLSVFLTFLRMSTDRELVALRAGGVSLRQMLPAPLLFSLVCMLLTLWVSLHWLAWGMERFRTSLLEIAGTRARIVVQPGVFNRDFPNLVLFARQVNPVSGEMRQVLVDDRSHPEHKLVILAPAGSIDTDRERGELVFRLHHGEIYSTGKEGASLLAFDRYLVRLPLSSLFKNVDLGDIRPREMAWDALLAADLESIRRTDPEFADLVAVEIQKRWAYPAACVALSLFALPLAAAFEGLRRQTGLVLALIMFFVYYSLMSLGFSMGETGAVPPVIGLWTPNLLFFLAGLYGIGLAEREKAPRLVSLLGLLRRRKQA